MTSHAHNDADVPPWIDRRLAVRTRHCDGTHFLVGNPHTFRGRISVWCARLGQEITISKPDVMDPSPEARIWIDGYLRGSEPPPPEFDDKATGEIIERAGDEWYEKRRRFVQTGLWPPPDEGGETDARRKP